MARPIRVAIVGYGKIARDEHLPSIAANPDFSLVAVAGGRGERPSGVRNFSDHHALLSEMADELDALAVCTPPGPRFAVARDGLRAGLHVLLEKPPCATVVAAESLERLAEQRGRTLFAAWHSQFAPAVAPAAAALAGRAIADLEIVWREDVRRWHPGQDWVFAPGGFGVFDPGINALSIVSRLAPGALLVEAADLLVPAGRAGPIAATLTLSSGTVRLDWRPVARDERVIRFRTEDGSRFEISEGGVALSVDGAPQPVTPGGEYPALYARFGELIAQGRSDVDLAPLRAVADAFLVAERTVGEPFSWDG